MMVRTMSLLLMKILIAVQTKNKSSIWSLIVTLKIKMSRDALLVTLLSGKQRNVELKKSCVSRKARVSERKSYERTRKLESHHTCRTCLMSKYERGTNY